MPHDWQTLRMVLGFTSPLNTSFNLLAYVGLLIFTWGIIDKKRQAWLFLIGGIMVWSFAVFGGNPIFVGAQTIMAMASFMRMRQTRGAPAITIFLTALVTISMYFRGDIDSSLHWLGVFAILGLVFGVAFAQTPHGNASFVLGGMLMAKYAYLVWSIPFLVLNIIFTLAVLWEIWNQTYYPNKKPI